jgi:SRSO17 transposase
MGLSVSPKKGPDFSFHPDCLRVMGARFMAICQRYSQHFRVGRKDVSGQAKAYLCGLVMKAPRKNIERMEEYVQGCGYESTQHFVSESPWEHRDLFNHVAQDVSEQVGGPQSVLSIDESAFTKKGEKSAGVAHQYNGRLGKVDNCQVGVFGALSNGTNVGLIDARLYLPREWIDAPLRCKAAGIPEEECVFKTKPQLGLEIVENAHRNGVRFGYVSFDGFYGNTPEFVYGLAKKGYSFVGAVHRDQTVYLEEPDIYLPRRKENTGRKHTRYRSRTAGIRADALVKQMGNQSWERVTVRNGAKGYVRFHAKRRKVWLWEEDTKNVMPVWLLLLMEDNNSNEVKYYISNAAADISLAELVKKAACRFFIERAFQDAKTSMGMADYQVRVWNGWHHHMGMVMLASLFMMTEKRLNKDNVSLLSCEDIVALLNHFLPRADTTEEAVFKQLEQRHKKRMKSMVSEYNKQAERDVILSCVI